MGRRKEILVADAVDIKESLIESALVLFAERGFASVTTKAIGEKTGVNSAMIYYYFKDKDGIFHQCLVTLIDRISRKYATNVAGHSSPADIINSWLDTHRILSEDIINLLKLMLDYSRSDVKNPLIDVQIKRFYDIERSLVVSAIPNNEAVSGLKISQEDLAYFVSTHLDGIIARSILEKDYSIVEALDRLLAVFSKLTDMR